MNIQSNPKSKWLSSGGKIKQVVRLQNINDPGGGDRAITVRQKAIYFSLFILMVTIWSAILLSAVFSLRINTNHCEQCPMGCTCKDSPPAWGG